jgi:hypothetical protein
MVRCAWHFVGVSERAMERFAHIQLEPLRVRVGNISRFIPNT